MRRTLALVALLLAATLARAGAAEEDLRRFYREVETLSADFEQRLIDEDGETLERYSGKLWMQRPGRFLWRYTSPYALELGSDGEMLWHYDVDLRQVTLRAAAESLGGTPAGLLGGDAEALAAYRIESLPAADGLEWLELTPRGDESDFARIRIGLADGRPQAMRLEDRLGQTTRLRFDALDTGAEPSPERFQPSWPDDVTVVDDRPPS